MIIGQRFFHNFYMFTPSYHKKSSSWRIVSGPSMPRSNTTSSFGKVFFSLQFDMNNFIFRSCHLRWIRLFLILHIYMVKVEFLFFHETEVAMLSSSTSRFMYTIGCYRKAARFRCMYRFYWLIEWFDLYGLFLFFSIGRQFLVLYIILKRLVRKSFFSQVVYLVEVFNNNNNNITYTWIQPSEKPKFQ